MERDIRRRLKKHFLYYLALIIIELAGLSLVFITAYDLRLQMTIVVMMSLFYVLWSALHHYIHHTLHTKILVEYVLVASFAIIITFFLFRI